MDSHRRTVPRSARRARSAKAVQEGVGDWGIAVTPSGGEHTRYAPSFDMKSPAAASDALPPIRTGVEAISPQCCEPTIMFSTAPLTRVRWLPIAGREAVAVAGSGDGGPEMDGVSFYVVRTEKRAVEARLARAVRHTGKVNDIAVSRTTGLLYCGSSDGSLRTMLSYSWDENDVQLHDVIKFPEKGLKHESIMGVAPLEGRQCFAFGACGSLVAADIEKGRTLFTIDHADSVGFRAGGAVDPDGGFEAVAAGSSGDISVWDCRVGGDLSARTAVLKHNGTGVLPLCVAVDATQPNFVLGGTAAGELAIWDRRGGDGYPLSRIALHDGFVWDVRVVTSRPGLLLSCGEDASVWLMDFGAAAARAAIDGWRETGECWRAQLTQSDLRNVSAQIPATLGVNSVCAHPSADLYAYTSDSASVTFGSLYS